MSNAVYVTSAVPPSTCCTITTMPSYLSPHTLRCSGTRGRRCERLFHASLSPFTSPKLRFARVLLGEAGRRTATAFLTERRADSAPSSAATAALPAAGRGQAARRQVPDAAPAGRRLSPGPGRPSGRPSQKGARPSPCPTAGAGREGGRPAPLLTAALWPAPAGASAASARALRALPARPPGRGAGRSSRAPPHPPPPPCQASPRLPPRGGAADERVRGTHGAYGRLVSRWLGHPSRLGQGPVPHCGHTALFTRAAGEAPAVS